MAEEGTELTLQVIVTIIVSIGILSYGGGVIFSALGGVATWWVIGKFQNKGKQQ